LSQAQLDAVSWSPMDPVDAWHASMLAVGNNARRDEAFAFEQAWWMQQGGGAEAPSSPQAEQLRRARRMQQQQHQQQEQPSSPQAAWIRQAKRVAQRCSGSASASTSPQRDGLGQSELDVLASEPPEEEPLRPGEPGSPQASQLLRLKRQQVRSALSSGAVLGPPHADAAAGGEGSPFFPRFGEAPPSAKEAGWPTESSPQARHLRMAKAARQATAQQVQQVVLLPGPSEAWRPAEEPWLHPMGDDPKGLSQAELNALSEAASPNAVRPVTAGHDGHFFSPDDPASPMAARMQHAKKRSRYAGSAACPGL